ncbi:MAG: rhodanese [Burkholderiales bacterium]|nr:rhodanese [Opitutaceae bacterium]
MSTPAPDSVPLEISVEETRDLLAARPDDVVLVDVREPFEQQTARIEGSEFIPMRQIPEHVGSTALPKDKHLLIHCHHGGRSLRVTEYLRAQGYPRVTNVAGGIHAWSQRIDATVPVY